MQIKTYTHLQTRLSARTGCPEISGKPVCDEYILIAHRFSRFKLPGLRPDSSPKGDEYMYCRFKTRPSGPCFSRSRDEIGVFVSASAITADDILLVPLLCGIPGKPESEQYIRIAT